MATAAQIEANRRNSQKSTGPKTPEGKAVSRGNAVKHGLSGEGVVLPPTLAQTIDDRLKTWLPSFNAEDPVQEWLARQICIESARVDACKIQEPAILHELTLRAQETWEQNRTLDARMLMRKLAKQPEVVQLQLLQTKQGCEELIERWKYVGFVVERKGGWEPKEWLMVLDLLGTPLDAREDSQPTPAHDLEWIANEIARLQKLQVEVLEARDERDRIATQAGRPIALPPELKNHRRYESTCQNRLNWAWKELKAMRQTIADLPAEPPADALPESEPKPEVAAAPQANLESKSANEGMSKFEIQDFEQDDTLTQVDFNTSRTEPLAAPQPQRSKTQAESKRKAKKARRAQAKARARSRRS